MYLAWNLQTDLGTRQKILWNQWSTSRSWTKNPREEKRLQRSRQSSWTTRWDDFKIFFLSQCSLSVFNRTIVTYTRWFFQWKMWFIPIVNLKFVNGKRGTSHSDKLIKLIYYSFCCINQGPQIYESNGSMSHEAMSQRAGQQNSVPQNSLRGMTFSVTL